MKEKDFKCVVCNGDIIYNEAIEKFICGDCKAEHSADMFGSQKKNKSKYSLRKIRILIAILATLYILYFWIRRIY